MSHDSKRRYEGKALHVVYDEELCIHAGECNRSQGNLFQADRQPWCQPDLATPADTAEVLSRCPSGALSATDTRGRALLEAPPPNQVTVSNDGPLCLRGELRIEGAKEGSFGLQRRATLCRCGHSKNKPYCDDSHRSQGFRDSGAVGVRQHGADTYTGVLVVGPEEDGPLLLKGAFALLTGTGRVAWSGERAALCRCGQSRNKPFCDGSHREAGFRSRSAGSKS